MLIHFYKMPFVLIGLSFITFYLIHKMIWQREVQHAVTLWNVKGGAGGFGNDKHQNPLLMNPWLLEFS